MLTTWVQVALQTVQEAWPPGQEVSVTMLPSSQTSGPFLTPSPQPVHTPAPLHRSPVVPALLSSHVAPAGIFASAGQVPPAQRSARSQTPAARHCTPSVLRMQSCVSVVVVDAHCPVAQLYAERVTVLLFVPVCAHVSL
jgi:hypothetical protein